MEAKGKNPENTLKRSELSDEMLDRVAGGKPENPQRIWHGGYR